MTIDVYDLKWFKDLILIELDTTGYRTRIKFELIYDHLDGYFVPFTNLSSLEDKFYSMHHNKQHLILYDMFQLHIENFDGVRSKTKKFESPSNVIELFNLYNSGKSVAQNGTIYYSIKLEYIVEYCIATGRMKRINEFLIKI